MRALILVLAAPLWAQAPADRSVKLIKQVEQFHQEPRVAVIVAVDQYQEESGFRKLDFATADARALADALRGPNFDYDVRLLLNEQATHNAIRAAIKGAAAITKDKGTLLFFFAGHGGEKDDKQYLAAWETGAENLGEFGLQVTEVEGLLNQSNAARKIIFVDACRNDPRASGRGTPEDSFQRLGRLQTAEGLHLLNATAPKQVSYEEPKLGHGIFTYFLLEALRGKAVDPYGLVTFRGLADYVEREVHDRSLLNGQQQIPYEEGGSSGDFILGGQFNSAGTTAAPAASSSSQPATASREAWERAKTAPNRRAALLAIIEAFPNSEEAGLARVDLAGMSASSGAALFDTAVDQFDKGDAALAGAAFDLVLKREPDNADAGAYRALLLTFDGADQEAIAAAEPILSRHPENLIARLARGVASASQGKGDAANSDLRFVADSAGSDAHSAFFRGVAFRYLNEYEKALVQFDLALRLQAVFPRASHNSGLTFTDLKRPDDAIQAFNEAINRNPNYTSARQYRGLTLEGQHKPGEAIQDYNEVLRLRPNDTNTLTSRARAYYNLKDYRHAVDDFTQVLAIHPKDHDALFSRGSTYYALANYAKAQADYTAALAVKPDDFYALTNRGGAYHMQKKYNEAIRDYTEALRLNPKYAIALTNRARAKEALGDKTGAAADAAAAARLQAQ